MPIVTKIEIIPLKIHDSVWGKVWGDRGKTCDRYGRKKQKLSQFEKQDA